MSMRALSLLCLLAISMGSPAVHAHPLAPSLLSLRALADGTFEVHFKRPSMQPRGSAVEPLLPAHCEVVAEPVSELEGTGVVTTWAVDCGELGLVGQVVGFSGFIGSGTNGLVQIDLAGGGRQQGVVHAGTPTLTVIAEPSRWQAALDYSQLGFNHILGGVDHLLFVLGLLLLVPSSRQLIATITAFTLGHSVTLSLAALGFVDAPTRPIEVAIAASIVYLANEIVKQPEGQLQFWRRPYVLAGGFGLLHGFGFAGALAEVGLPAGDIPIALASFNIGIEIGQLAFVMTLVGLFLALGRLAISPPSWGRGAAAYGIGSLAAMWMYERIASLI